MTLKGFKTSVEEGTADVVEVARELELEVELEDVTGWRQSRGKTLMDEELLLTDDQRKWRCDVTESTPDEDAGKTVEMKTKGLEYYVNLVDKASSGRG